MLYLYRDGQIEEQWVTTELPWRANRVRRSCIPPRPGKEISYEVEPHMSPRFGQTLWVRGVTGRSEILLHAGNYVSDTVGCILVGKDFDDLDRDGITDITASQVSVSHLTELVDEPTELTIGWARIYDMPRLAADELPADVDLTPDLSSGTTSG
jgi:hypothetical protein